MKALWFTHIPPKAAVEHQGLQFAGNGFQIHSLIDRLTRCNDLELTVAYGYKGRPQTFERDRVQYVSIPVAQGIHTLGPLARRCDSRMLEVAREIIRRIRPDVIHVHGTESVFGLMKVHGLTDVPTVLSIQGLMEPCAQFAWGEKTFWNMLPLQGMWDARRAFPFLRQRRMFQLRGRREAEILGAVDGVIGRTDWDRSYTWSVAPKAKYFHLDELMRPEFLDAQWSLQACQRRRIYTSGRLTFAKGMHVFLDAMALLKREYHDLDVYIAGDRSPTCEYRYLLRKTREMGLSETVHFTGWLPGPRITDELRLAHVYANSSFVENSCNSLAEAMLMALPCVTGFVGGMGTTMEHRKSGLMYPRGDGFMLADYIREIFENDGLAVGLGLAARACARERHDPDRIVRDLLAIYQNVASKQTVSIDGRPG